MQRRINRGHRHVYPDVDRTELTFGPFGRALDGVGVGDVDGQGQRASPGGIYLLSGNTFPIQNSCPRKDKLAAFRSTSMERC
jgi:hypothetical protein